MELLPATDLAASAAGLFRSSYGHGPEVAGRAPGRVNLIGEHTDYNGGLCLPIALAHSAWVGAGRRPDVQVAVTSAQAPGDSWCGDPEAATGWAAYAAGVVWALRAEGVDVPGLDLAVDSAVPVGAGLSSSAALGCAVAAAVDALVGPLGADLLERAAVRGETVVAGAPTGGMDQAVAVYAEPGAALLMDFGSGGRRQVPWRPPDLSLLVVDTGVRHAHVGGEYADRRQACVEAAAALGVRSLREVSLDDLAGRDEPWVPRARHVVTENARVGDLVASAEAGDWAVVGALMTASHVSLRDDLEVSCRELDVAVTSAIDAGALGARMTGGGFGGSAIALVPDYLVAEVAASVDRAYDACGLTRPAYLRAEASGGVTAGA